MKEVVRQTKIYIRPIQNDLSMEVQPSKLSVVSSLCMVAFLWMERTSFPLKFLLQLTSYLLLHAFSSVTGLSASVVLKALSGSGALIYFHQVPCVLH